MTPTRTPPIATSASPNPTSRPSRSRTWASMWCGCSTRPIAKSCRWSRSESRRRRVEKPANAALTDVLRAKPAAHSGSCAATRSRSQRLLQTPQGLMAFASHEIVATGGRGEPRGILLFGRFIDESSSRARSPDQPACPCSCTRRARSDSAIAGSVVAAVVRRPARARTGCSWPTDEQRSSISYGVLRDIDGASAAVISDAHRSHAAASSGSTR